MHIVRVLHVARPWVCPDLGLMKADCALANLDAYDTWAATYPPVPHNPLMRAEQQAMLDLWPRLLDLEAASTLDLACGTGRYAQVLTQRGASRVVAMDLSEAMLRRLVNPSRVRADMMQLPFAASSFDLVVSGLAVGHAPRLESWMAEIARVLKPGGVLLYSDFHPEAAAAGMTRSFTDGRKRKHTLLHREYDLAAHEHAAMAVMLDIEATREPRVGVDMAEQFEGSADFYRSWHGVAIVLAIRARKRGV